MFWGKLFPTKYDLVVAICDEDLIEKEIEMKNHKIKVSKSFYGGELIDEDLAVKAMKRATIGNLIGKKIVSLAEKNHFITKENIISISGTPHAQFVKLQEIR
ncbi:MAG TPA: DUF424 family protein [archaeon]|nr:DUF424 family protein [archaeon]